VVGSGLGASVDGGTETDWPLEIGDAQASSKTLPAPRAAACTKARRVIRGSFEDRLGLTLTDLRRPREPGRQVSTPRAE
jgi:hypothetical protein